MQQNDAVDKLPSSVSVKMWEATLTLEEKNPSVDVKRDFNLVKAKPEDMEKIHKFYQHHAIAGYDIQSVEIVYNPHTELAFESHLHKLQKREGNPAFVSKWEKESSTVEEKNWREAVVKQWHSLAYKDESHPDVKILPLWHGTNPAILGSIFETGYANLATTDSGFFGKGLYFSHEAEYAYRVYSHGKGKKSGELGEGGILLLNWVACYSAYPVIHGDMSKLTEKGNYQNYDAHFIPVIPGSSSNPNEMNYYPCKRPDQLPVYHEMVVFESAASLPRYLITLQAQFLISPQAKIVDPIQLYQQGMAYKKGNSVPQDFKKAFECFSASAQLEFPLGQIELGWCYRKGEGVAKDFNAAVECFNLAAKAGIASAIHELGWCYKRGEGVPQSMEKAAECFQLASDKGLACASFDIGCCYFTGTGVEKNRAKAVYYFKQAADKGILKAQICFAECCVHGDGVSKNLHKAVKYYRLAAAQGDEKSKENLVTLLNAQLGNLHGQNRNLLLPLPTNKENNSTVVKQNEYNETNDEKCRLQ